VNKPKWFPNDLHCNRCGKPAPIILGWHNPDLPEHDNPDALVCIQCFEQLSIGSPGARGIWIRRDLEKVAASFWKVESE
jgi:hypothetical protein